VSGQGAENLGTITVPAHTVLEWSCSTSATDNGNVIVGNNPSDPKQIDVNALGQASGQTVVDAGTYHDVTINTEGDAWTLTFAHPDARKSPC
jgi:hypothetical protein